jgi:hypothetical protein
MEPQVDLGKTDAGFLIWATGLAVRYRPSDE